MTYIEWSNVRTQNISTHILTRRMTENIRKWGGRNGISTHILTRRMTGGDYMADTASLFQLTSSRGGWHCYEQWIGCRAHFNSHPHEEDDVNPSLSTPVIRISTHILTRRMTESNRCGMRRNDISTHILTRRMTKATPEDMIRVNISTHILTRRMTEPTQHKTGFSDISTHILTRRMTESNRCGMRRNDISTHILTRRMTGCSLFLWFLLCISTHILTRRMTVLSTHQVNGINISTHILTRRMTWLVPGMPRYTLNFNSHPHEEDDILSAELFVAVTYFNSHPHEEDDGNACAPCCRRYISTHILTRRMTTTQMER